MQNVNVKRSVTEILVQWKNWSGGPKFPEYLSSRADHFFLKILAPL